MVALLFLGGCGKKKKTTVKKAAVDSTLTSGVMFAEAGVEEEMEGIEYFDEEEELALSEDEGSFDLAEADLEEFDEEEEAEKELSWGDEEESKFAFKTIQFDLNSDNIADDQRAVLEENALLAKEAAEEGRTVIVQGHSCQMGEDKTSFNLKLSVARAKAVKDELINMGVPAENIEIVGCGQEMPMVFSDADDRDTRIEELAENRRVELVVV
jgi:outer membrane protein OmpA-like peptidoglycan-associated protein